MKSKTKIKFIAGYTAFCIVLSGYVLTSKIPKTDNTVITFSKSNITNNRQNKVCIINNDIENNPKIDVKLFNEEGQLIKQWTQEDKSYTINDLKDGLYTIEYITSKNSFKSSNILITANPYTEIHICDGETKIYQYLEEKYPKNKTKILIKTNI